jgi:hypothetical protein
MHSPDSTQALPDMPAAPASSASTANQFNPGIWHNLKLGLRAALLMPLPHAQLAASWGQLVALIGLGVLLQLGWDVSHIGRQGELALIAAPGALFIVAVLIIASWALASSARRSNDTLQLAVLLFATTLPIDFCFNLSSRLLDRPWVNQAVPNWLALSSYFSIGWLTLASAVACMRWYQVKHGRWACLLAALLFIGGPLSQVYVERSLWVRPVEENPMLASNNPGPADEDMFYLQPQLLDSALGQIKPGVHNKMNVFFVGAAGAAEQEVFMREMNFVEQFMRRRFHTKERSIILVNHSKSVATTPIASGTSLRAALQRVSQVMDHERDVLMLYLSSHGSADFKFTLSFGAMRFNDLDPETLRQILDESGIEKRIIIISACYSGGFIAPLKNDNSLIITAAASDRTSFGCDNEADFTYFGQAFFKDALAQNDNLSSAFEQAKRAIREREKQNGFDDSKPQIFIGRKIAPLLRELARQYPANPPANPMTKVSGH